MTKITREFIDKKLDEIGCGLLIFSSGYHELIPALEKLNPIIDNVIEIGTHNGLSSSVLTGWANRVFTFDINVRNNEFVWNILGVRNKISSFSGNREELEWEINYIQESWKEQGLNIIFDFAFIDGNHDYEWVKRDFELVKFTKRVLFHDCDICPGVRGLINEIGAITISPNIGYWEENEI
jgi:hypothetical protein